MEVFPQGHEEVNTQPPGRQALGAQVKDGAGGRLLTLRPELKAQALLPPGPLSCSGQLELIPSTQPHPSPHR